MSLIRRYRLKTLAACLLIAPGLAISATVPEPQPNDVLQRLQEVNSQYAALIDKIDTIEEQRQRIQMLMQQVEELEEQGGTKKKTAAREDSEQQPQQQPQQQAKQQPQRQAKQEPRQDASKKPVEVATDHKQALQAQAQDMPDLPRVSNEVGGVLTPRGRLTIEPSVGFSYSSVNRIAVEGFTILPALLIGIIDVVEADRETYTTRLAGRYGITNRFEAELSGSWIYRDDSTRSREFLTGAAEDSVFNASGKGFGDLELGLRYQFKRRKPTSPFLVGNVRVKSTTGSDPFEISRMSELAGQPQFASELPTGSGFWSISPSLSFVYPSDPVVFFGSVGYLWTLEDDKGTWLDDEGNIMGFGNVNPGDAFRASFGLGLGLNEHSSFSISYSLDQFTRTRIETAADPLIAGSDVTVGKLTIGYSLALPSGRPLNLAVGIGTTDDAPDTDVTFRMPFHFGQ